MFLTGVILLFSIYYYYYYFNSSNIKPTSKPTKDDAFCIPKAVYMTGYDRFHNYRKIGTSGKNIIIELAMKLLYQYLHSTKLTNTNVQHLSLIEPMIPLFYKCLLQCKSDDVLILCIQCFTIIITWNLKTLTESFRNIVDGMFIVMKSAGGTTKSDVVQACIKCISIILNQKKSFTFTNDQIKYILSMISMDIENIINVNNNFSYIKAVVNRHIQLTEIYELIEKLQNLLLTSPSEQIRTKSGQVLSQFLLVYGKDTKLTKIHLNFLLKNMSFIYESGRLSCYDLIYLVVLKFDPNVYII